MPKSHRYVLSESAQKLRGGYYTSSEVAEWLCKWAIRSSAEKVLEPSCGDGAFLVAAARRFEQLGVSGPKLKNRLIGIEIDSAEASKAIERLKIFKATRGIVRSEDFFGWWQKEKPSVDAVVGNPPFIRYQAFPEQHRDRAMRIMQSKGLTPNRLTNIWVPFVVAATASLKAGGRLALVIPAELFQVSYAAQLRAFLTERFKRVNIVTCNELFFSGAEQEVLLLLADDLLLDAVKDNHCQVTVTERQTVREITTSSPKKLFQSAERKIVQHDGEKWLKYFLDQREITFMRELRASEITTSLRSYGSVDVGVVTGKNEFFVLTEEQVHHLGLKDHVKPLVSRSMHLRGAKIDNKDWKQLSSAGGRVHLLDIKSEIKLNSAVLKYISVGEERSYHTGYKCSIRKPWYQVPSAWIPEGFMFRQIYDFPRLVLNKSKATSTDTIHRLTCRNSDTERVIANTYTWLTAASAEIEGRSYGGGVLELEPTEAERLLLPAKLNGAMPMSETDKLTRNGKLNSVLEENARIVLADHMGLSKIECVMLHGIWSKLRDRRMSRKRTQVA